MGRGVSPNVLLKWIEPSSFRDRFLHFVLWLTLNAYVASASPALVACRSRLQPHQFLWQHLSCGPYPFIGCYLVATG